MSLQTLISQKIQKIAEKAGEITLFIVSVLLMFNYFKVINLDNLGIPCLVIILWVYLSLNIGLANVFKFFRNKDNPICPRCKGKLTEFKEYECSKCGKLRFDNS